MAATKPAAPSPTRGGGRPDAISLSDLPSPKRTPLAHSPRSAFSRLPAPPHLQAIPDISPLDVQPPADPTPPVAPGGGVSEVDLDAILAEAPSPPQPPPPPQPEEAPAAPPAAPAAALLDVSAVAVAGEGGAEVEHGHLAHDESVLSPIRNLLKRAPGRGSQTKKPDGQSPAGAGAPGGEGSNPDLFPRAGSAGGGGGSAGGPAADAQRRPPTPRVLRIDCSELVPDLQYTTISATPNTSSRKVIEELKVRYKLGDIVTEKYCLTTAGARAGCFRFGRARAGTHAPHLLELDECLLFLSPKQRESIAVRRVADVFQELPNDAANKKRQSWLAASKRVSTRRRILRSLSGRRQTLDDSVLVRPQAMKSHVESVKRFMNVRQRHYLVNVSDFSLSHVESHRPLDAGLCVFGRRAHRNVASHVIRGRDIRDRHAAIVVEDNLVVVVPLAGKVSLNGRPILTPQALSDRQQLGLGSVNFRVRISPKSSNAVAVSAGSSEQLELLPTMVPPRFPAHSRPEALKTWAQGVLDNVLSVLPEPQQLDDSGIDTLGGDTRPPSTAAVGAELPAASAPESSPSGGERLARPAAVLVEPRDSGICLLPGSTPPRPAPIAAAAASTPPRKNARTTDLDAHIALLLRQAPDAGSPAATSTSPVAPAPAQPQPGLAAQPEPAPAPTPAPAPAPELASVDSTSSSTPTPTAGSSRAQTPAARALVVDEQRAAPSPTWVQAISKQIATQAMQRFGVGARSKSLTDLNQAVRHSPQPLHHHQPHQPRHQPPLYSAVADGTASPPPRMKRWSARGLSGSVADVSTLTRLGDALKDQAFSEEAAQLISNLNESTTSYNGEQVCETWTATVDAVLAESHARLIDLFCALDRDSDGYLSPDDVLVGCIRMDLMVTKPESDALFATCDRDGDGRLDFADFANAWNRRAARAKPTAAKAPTSSLARTPERHARRRKRLSLREYARSSFRTPPRVPPLQRGVSTPILAHVGPDNPLTPTILHQVQRGLNHVDPGQYGAVAAWTVRDVKDWLRFNGLSTLISRFELHCIDGQRLLHLTPQALEALGVTDSEKAKRVLAAAERLSKDGVPSDAHQMGMRRARDTRHHTVVPTMSYAGAVVGESSA